MGRTVCSKYGTYLHRFFVDAKRDIDQPRVCQSAITLSAPAWRARFTPFGDGIVTMPQKKECDLQLWNVSKLDAPVHSFVGHADLVREFVWRKEVDTLTGETGYQLLTWSKDQHMRLWALDRKTINVMT